MTILVNGKEIVAHNAECGPDDVIAVAEQLNVLDGDPFEVPADAHSVCVLQSESCSVPWGCGGYVGSQDATTCVIAFVLSRASVNVVHFDDGNSEVHSYLGSSVEGIEATEEGVQLHLVGSYDDEGGVGRQILRNILNYYHRHPVRFNLGTAMVGSLNTRRESPGHGGVRLPIYSGACVDLATRQLKPATFADR